jgi:hypothetical protein
MANTWNSTTFTNIARAGFKAFTKKLAPLGVFSTDFSSEAVDQGTVVATRIVPVSDAAVDLQDTSTGGSGDRESSNIIKDITTATVSVTLNQQPVTGFKLTDEEAAYIGSGVWEDTKNKILQNKAWAVANYVLNYAFNLVTRSNYTTAAYTGAASAFDMDDVVDLATAASTAGWPVDSNYLLLCPEYLGALKKDNHIQDLSASGIKVVQNGEIQKLDRFNVVEAPTLMSGLTVYDASEYLRGFMCTPAAAAIAMRAVKAQATDKLEAYEVMTDPDSGATLVYRAWYKPSIGSMYHTYETLFGASKAQVEALQRVASA